MLHKVSELKMHRIRWVIVIGWLVLILSLFYDPITHNLTDPNNLFSPFRDSLPCVLVQGECLPEQPYPIGTRVFWGMVIPCAIAIVLIFGHETWRRICPLYFLSQIPRALGLKPLLNINNNRWLINYHFYLQFTLLFIGLNSRILFINSARLALGIFLLTTILSAITIVFLYGGRSWCHYVCPFGIVQIIFTGPRGLLASNPGLSPPGSITQSMCRTVDKKTGREISACVGCKSACFDIDAEKAYWEDLHKPGRKLVQYGYLGLVISYFVYYRLYAGNFDYYFSGAWIHEENQLATLGKPGFYIFNQAINIPKLVAVPLTLILGVIITYWICGKVEKLYTAYVKKRQPLISSQQILHRFFSLCTFVAFNCFFIYGGRPEILRLPIVIQLLFNAFIVLVSVLWLVRTWNRSEEKYNQDKLAHSFRRQLEKLPIDISSFLNQRTLKDLTSDELFLLASVIPEFRQKERLQIYKAILKDGLLQQNFTSADSLEVLKEIRSHLDLNQEQHYLVLSEIIGENPDFLYPNQPQIKTYSNHSSDISKQADLPTLIRRKPN
ncbi:MAG: 4Fe-4S binding protein [Richelia sp. RM2_1_2]|nr:4Fe-4S binding protein [Richelia sp. SM1_7_0]NJN07113.1 4Fe-4S binding protein [Richelia sp. RM1_1_1]NJO26131.1 4Fe-4S binding protein [Richelia sp. SL_2_1]NJO58843.1 4Fe-4S binding protein [Richelia sp. RM2_1_2]